MPDDTVVDGRCTQHEIISLRLKFRSLPDHEKGLKIWYTYNLGTYKNLRAEAVLVYTMGDVFTMHTVQNFAFMARANGTFVSTREIEGDITGLPQRWGYIDE